MASARVCGVLKLCQIRKTSGTRASQATIRNHAAHDEPLRIGPDRRLLLHVRGLRNLPDALPNSSLRWRPSGAGLLRPLVLRAPGHVVVVMAMVMAMAMRGDRLLLFAVMNDLLGARGHADLR